MRKEYDFSKSKKNTYAKQLKLLDSMETARPTESIRQLFSEHRHLRVGLDCALHSDLSEVWIDSKIKPETGFLRLGTFCYVAGTASLNALDFLKAGDTLLFDRCDWRQLASGALGSRATTWTTNEHDLRDLGFSCGSLFFDDPPVFQGNHSIRLIAERGIMSCDDD
jgi:hypothetical protein